MRIQLLRDEEITQVSGGDVEVILLRDSFTGLPIHISVTDPERLTGGPDVNRDIGPPA